jgi:MFS family permease
MLLRQKKANGGSRRYEIVLIGVLFFTWGTVFLDRMSQLDLGPYLAPAFHLTHEQIGLLASVLAIAWAVSTLLFGALSDRFGRRRILIPAVFPFSLLRMTAAGGTSVSWSAPPRWSGLLQRRYFPPRLRRTGGGGGRFLLPARPASSQGS